MSAYKMKASTVLERSTKTLQRIYEVRQKRMEPYRNVTRRTGFLGLFGPKVTVTRTDDEIVDSLPLADAMHVEGIDYFDLETRAARLQRLARLAIADSGPDAEITISTSEALALT